MRLLTFILMASALNAQTPRTVTLTWTPGVGNPPGTTTTVYRATGLCTGTPNFSKISEGITGATFVDDTVVVGNYCYMVTAVASGMESVPSNFALAAVSPRPHQSLLVTVQ